MNVLHPIATCDICVSGNNTRPAFIWCPECDQYLCSECNEQHSISRSSENHLTQNVKDYLQLPEFIRTLRNQCSVHGLKFDFLCPKHDVLCCIQCVQNKHKICGKLTPLSSIVSDIGSSSIITELEKTFAELELNFQCMIDKCEENIETLTSSRDTCESNVLELSLAMEAQLRKFEKKVISELNLKYVKRKNMKELHLNKCKLALEKVSKTYSGFESMKLHASDMQILLGIREIDTSITEDMDLMQTLMHDESFTVTNCEFNISPVTKYITSGQTLLGHLSMVDVPVNFIPCALRKKEALDKRPAEQSVQQYILQRHLQIPIPDGKQPMRITGCTFAKTGEIVMADNANERLLVFEENGSLKRDINVNGSPVDVAPVHSTMVATTLADKSKIKFIDIETGSTRQKVLIPGPGYGLSACIDNETDQIVIRISNDGFMILDTSGRNNHFVKFPSDCILYVSYKAEHFYFTKWDVNDVVCCDKTGKIKWEFENEILVQPRGIALTDEGYVIVAGFNSNNIVIISGDGLCFKELYKNCERLKKPTALSYHSEKDNSRLMVTNLIDGVCNIFRIKIDK